MADLKVGVWLCPYWSAEEGSYIMCTRACPEGWCHETEADTGQHALRAGFSYPPGTHVVPCKEENDHD